MADFLEVDQLCLLLVAISEEEIVIAQAQGMLMGCFDVFADEALDLLVMAADWSI